MLLTFFVLFSLVISENGFAKKHWNPDYMKATWSARDRIRLNFVAYVYSGPNTEYGYLDDGVIKVSYNGTNFYPLFEIKTQRQKQKSNTKLWLSYIYWGTLISFNNNIRITCQEFSHPELSSRYSNMVIQVPNCEEFAKVDLDWTLQSEQRNARFIQISGKWHLEGTSSSSFETFEKTCEIEKPGSSMLKFNSSVINDKSSNNNAVKILKDSEVIVIKGAKPGAIIKVYNTSGAIIKSVISNNDVVKIQLPAKQIYSVYVGKSQYKVAL